jgi:hypothetical protein
MRTLGREEPKKLTHSSENSKNTAKDKSQSRYAKWKSQTQKAT